MGSVLGETDSQHAVVSEGRSIQGALERLWTGGVDLLGEGTANLS